jgi:hypothetical protein
MLLSVAITPNVTFPEGFLPPKFTVDPFVAWIVMTSVRTVGSTHVAFKPVPSTVHVWDPLIAHVTVGEAGQSAILSDGRNP